MKIEKRFEMIGPEEIMKDFTILFGYETAVIIKNLIIGFATLIVGLFLGVWYCASIGTNAIIDPNVELDKDEINMLIIKKGRKRALMAPPHLTTKEWVFNIFVYALNGLGLIKGPRISKKNIKQAKLIFIITVLICSLIILLAIELSFTVMIRPDPDRIRMCKELLGL